MPHKESRQLTLRLRKMAISGWKLLGIMKIKLAFLLLLIFGITTVNADQRLVPANLVKWPETGADHAILVDKSKQKILVFEKDDLFKPIKEFRCSTGENSGPKSRKNDKKTPEGVYFFIKSFVKRQLSHTYGILAFPLDYPNQMDKKQGKGGYGIWFHGTEEVLKPRDTNGCVVLENRDIKELASYITLYHTPVIITDKITRIPPERLKKQSESLEKLVRTWAHTWEKKDIDRYMAAYSREFASRGMDYDRWKAYKTRLARKYEKINVAIENLQLYRTQDGILAKFNQAYSTKGFNSYGTKRLYLAKNSNEWKIIAEFFSEAKGKKMRLPLPSLTLQDVENFVGYWKNAWERKDLGTYISFYDKNFRSNGMDLKAWKKHKASLNKKYRSIKITISGIKLVDKSKKSANIRFRQSYTADAYHDSGIKKLVLVKKGNHWKIKNETWQPIRTKN